MTNLNEINLNQNSSKKKFKLNFLKIDLYANSCLYLNKLRKLASNNLFVFFLGF